MRPTSSREGDPRRRAGDCQTYCYLCDAEGDLIYGDSFAHEDCEAVVGALRRVLESPAPGGHNLVVRCGGGSLEIRSVAARGFSGFLCLYHTAVTTDEHSRLAALAERNLELLSAVEASNDGIVIADADRRYTYCNPSYRRISGLAWHELVGHTAEEMIQAGAVNNATAPTIFRTKKPYTATQTFRTGVSTTISGNPVLDANGEISKVIVNVRDTTELEQLRAELNASRDKLTMFTEVIETLQGQQSSLLFASTAMRAVHDDAVKFARVDAPLLIMGETGVGKEVVADVVHKLSPRQRKPFLKINCAAIPEHLLESELFGYEGGAFTSARKGGRIGLFELADGGTVFLDEVDSLPFELQAKLLRFLQRQEFYRVGGNRLIKVDVRLIAATNKNVDAANSEATFRTDFFYRLYVLSIRVPPLREREEDILALSRMFLNQYNEKYNTAKQIDPDVYRRLLAYPWPGNVRELQNMIERLVVVSNGPLIKPEHLPAHLGGSAAASSRPPEGSYRQARERFERAFWQEVVRRHRTTREMAGAAGVTHSTVVKRIRALRLRREDL